MDLSVKYLGYDLKNPIIVGSSGLTNSVEKIKKLEANNAGAVVLKSLFEEQILATTSREAEEYVYPEGYDYIQQYSKTFNEDKFLYLIEDARKAVDIPIIASVNARANGNWVEIAKKMEAAGAHAIELNISILPVNPKQSCEKLEKLHLKILKDIKKRISIPISIKISSYLSGLAGLVEKIAWSKNADAIVMFNRFYNPDINIDKMEMTVSNVFSEPNAPMPSLRWIAMFANKYPISFVGSTGIYDGEDVIKQLLVGADAVQMVSSIYKNSPAHINTVLKKLKDWMSNKNYSSISDFKGKMAIDNLEQPEVFERIQFMKYFGNV